ncbi:MAG: ATP-binding protein [bacterium]|nr:ATP-binding protein [bacterium]
MIYKNRLIEDRLNRYVESFACVLVTGARQVGKSTLLEQRHGTAYKSFVFDPAQDIYGVRQDPDLFLRNNAAPLILDEIQYVPELVPALKRYIDRDRRPGLYLITGSQQWHVMRNLAESLAGRVAILELASFCLQEMAGTPDRTWLNTWMAAAPQDIDDGIEALRDFSPAKESVTKTIWRGGFPEVQTLQEDVIPGWMQGYVSTYLLRDIRSMLEVRDEMQFGNFLGLCASLTGQECNYSQLGRDIGLSSPAAKRWIGVLRGTFQWLEVPAYAANHIKRLSSRPKGYLSDTGLACYLMRLSSPSAVQGHPAFGALFETLVVTEFWKQLQRQPLVPAMYHYRQHSGTEVDLIIEKDGLLFPIEIKASSQAHPSDARSIETFRRNFGEAVQPGLVVYAGREVLRLSEGCIAAPFDLL